MTTGDDDLSELAAASSSVPEKPEEPGRPLLIFRTGQRWFAVDPHQIHEVVVRGPVTQIPTAPPHVLGLSLIRGRLVPVISLQVLLGYRGDGEPAQTLPRIIVLRVSGLEVAVICDETKGISEISSADASDTRAARPRCISGEVDWSGKLVLVLDAAEIVRAAMGETEAA